MILMDPLESMGPGVIVLPAPPSAALETISVFGLSSLSSGKILVARLFTIAVKFIFQNIKNSYSHQIK